MAKIFLLACTLFFAAQFQALGQRIPVERLKILPPKNLSKKATAASSAKSTNRIARMDIAPGCDSIFLGSQSDIDNFSINHPDCDTIRTLVINGESASPAITNLNGLSSIVAVTEQVFITKTSVTTLAGMSNLDFIGQSLRLEENNALTTIGLPNLQHLGRIVFKKLPALTDISGLSNHITSIGSVVIEEAGLESLHGLENIEHITEFDGLTISNTPLLSLSNLENIKTIQGYVKLDNMPAMTHIGITTLEQAYGFLFAGMPQLTSIAGISDQLTNTNIGTFWMISTGLTNLTGMDRITSASNFYVWFNPNLTTLQGLNSLAGNIGGGVYISGNDNLTNISAISNITSVDGSTLELNANGSLSDASALNNIVLIGGGLWIQDNPLLTSLNFLNNALVINNNNNDEVRIRGNSQLAVCSITAICNYLAAGKPAIIENNSAGCNSISEINSQCASCTGGTTKRWTGNESNDWNNPNNWAEAGVPGICDTVVIPEGVGNYPMANGNIVIRGLIMESSTYIDLGDYSLTSTGVLNMQNANIYSNGGSNSISFNNSENIHIEYSGISAANINFSRYTGQLFIDGSEFFGRVNITDDETRTGETILNASRFYGDLTITSNGTDASATSRMAENGDVEVSGNLTLVLNQPNNFWIGSSSELRLEGDFILQTDIDSSLLYFGNISLVNGTSSHITQNGSTSITFRYLRMQKNIGARVTLEQPVYIENDLRLYTGLIKTTPQNLLIFKDNATVSQTSSASWVSGPVKKIGDEQFTYPIGDDTRQAIVTILAPPLPTDAYTAEYFHVNPATAGFNTALHETSLTSISNKEYWMIGRDPGSSDILIGLSYDSTRSTKTGSIYSLRTSQWDGSKWLNKGSIFLSGNLAEAYLTSGVIINTFDQPMTLGYIEPPIIPIITMGPMDTVVCRGNSFKVRFSVDTAMFSGNDFLIQLSDSAGSFANPRTLNTLVDHVESDSATVFMPLDVKLSEHYRVRVVGNSPPDTSINTRPLAVRIQPTLAFTIQGPQPGCIGSGVNKYYVSVKEPGTSYNWTLTGGGTFTANNDTIYITWTTPGNHTLNVSASNICGSGPSANKVITVGHPAPTAAPSLNKTGRWLYASSPDASQNAIGFHWYRNGDLIAGANSASYYASAGGTYKVHYYNLCGDGPSSSVFVYAENAVTQTINFPAVVPKTYGDSAFIINSTASSGFPVSLSIVSGPGTLSGNVYTITTTGTVTIKAIQLGDDIYDTAAYVLQTFVINKAPQTITFPPMGDKAPGTPAFALNATASSGLPVSFSLVSGPATLLANQLTVTGLGNVSLNATQAGDTNYLPAVVSNQVFCVRVAELNSISGPLFACPGQTATYKINQVPGLSYSWRLSNGTSFPSTNDSVVITWGGAGTYSLIVSAIGPCGPASANDSLVVTVAAGVTPGAVTNMLPANNSSNLQLPVTLSWLPGSNALSYDVYVWDSAAAQPAVPFASNISGVSLQIPLGAFPHNKAYKWKVVAKNACLQADGSVQTFRLRALPDLVVSQVQMPASATSGQPISLSWRVSNNGPGNTSTNQSWTDAVFLSFDTIPNFTIPPTTGAGAWSQLDFPVRPLLVATRPNVSALDSGQHYNNSVNFTLPLNYAQPLYLYVVTNYPNSGNAPLQMTYANDTARAPQPINVTLAPTPDLRVDTVLTSASVFSGSTISVTYKVKNYGVLTPAGQQWTDKIYISQNPIFNINTAIPLNLPKANGSYYPDASAANIVHSTQLQADSSYTKNAQVVIPNFITGPYYLFVVTNHQGSLYEGLLSSNNSNKANVQVFLTPTPTLTVNTVSVPVSQASITQPIGVNWIIRNTGFADNIEKNKGHYYLPAGNCSPSQVNLVDSIGQGSSYWIDQVYVSTDPNGLNGNAILVGSFTQGIMNGSAYADQSPATKCVPAGGDLSIYNVNTGNVIRPSSTHPGQLNFTVPNYLPAGNYYVYVQTNSTRTVFEYPGTVQVKRSDLPILIQRPDLTVPALNLPAAITGGQTFNIQYTVLNNGAGTVFNQPRKDRIYMSSSPVFDGSAVLISTQTFTETLPVGGTVSHSIGYSFNASVNGLRYIFIQTNYDSSFRENNYANNFTSGSISVTAAAPVDWVLSSVTTADSVTTIFPTSIRYQVNNAGAGNANGAWVDSLFISCNPVFNYSTAFSIGTRLQSRTVNSGSGYRDSLTFTLPYSWGINACFPNAEYSPVYFFVKVNADNAIFEASNTSNNTLGSGIKVLVNPLVDHIVTTVSAADTATVARPYYVSWTVKNAGRNPGPGIYYAWFDAVYFSPDSVFNANAKLANSFYENSAVNTQQTYSDTKLVIPPAMPSGDYYVLVRTNIFNQINGEVQANNVNLLRDAFGFAKKIYVVQPLLPDLTDSIITAPALSAIGQPLTVVHRMTNVGTGETYPNTWSNNIWLSQDFIPGNAGDILLSTKNTSGVLQPGQFRNDTVTITLPLALAPGNYLLLCKVDAGNGVVESNDSNNVASRSISIYAPAPSDLLVENISKPDTAILGYTLNTIQWELVNNAVNNASGVSSDGVYLSKNNLLDSSATLVGVLEKTINIPALGRKSESMQPMIGNVVEGEYHVMIKTDLLNNILESNKDNNTGIAISKVYVKANELKLGIASNTTLQHISRYYKLVIPDSLRGSTILVTLKTNDSLTMRNELFFGTGYVPTAARSDYRFETPNYGNQQIVIASVEDTVYYIAARCVSPSPVLQNIKLTAVKLPFSILMVRSNTGGNSGNVTIKINGSLFTPGMTAKLSNAAATIYASSIYYNNSTNVFATFNLKGRPLGLYDVTLEKPDSTLASLAGSFSIVPPDNGGVGGAVNTGSTGNGNDPGCDPGAPAGLNSLLVTEVVIPKKVFAGWPFVIQVNFVNPTNNDLPAQVRIIYNDYGVPIAATQADLPNAKTSMYLELTEPGGPPGIIRAGATGTITLHSRAPQTTPGHTIINFILK